MSFRSWRVWGLAGAVVIAIGASVMAQGARSQEPDVQTALLTEVRALRQAMEQLAGAGPRVQLAFGRLQLQEQRINSMLRRAEALRDSLAAAEKELASTQGQLGGLEKMFKSNEVPAEEMNPMTAMIEGLKKAVTLQTSEVTRLQAEEATLQGQIASEQARWTDINRVLDELERTLGRR
jgi:chromosome segregation ATPase